MELVRLRECGDNMACAPWLAGWRLRGRSWDTVDLRGLCSVLLRLDGGLVFGGWSVRLGLSRGWWLILLFYLLRAGRLSMPDWFSFIYRNG